MTVNLKDYRCGADPVMSQAGAVPGPNASMKMGPPSATRGQTCSRHVKVRQRRRFREHKKLQKPDQPKDQQSQPNCLNILQINVSGIDNKKIELANMFSEKNVHVALVQESQHQNADPHISGYTYTACDHPREDCRGVITYIRNDVTGSVEISESSRPTDIHKITIWHEGSKYTIYNVYNPPWNHFNFSNFPEIIFNKTVIAGDFNGHSPQWGYKDYNPTGKAIEELCSSTNLTVLQDEESTPTLLFRVNKKTYRPDLTIVSSDLLHRHTIDVLNGVGSDHRPIFTSLYSKKRKKYKRKTKWNFKKANWDAYQEKSNQMLKTVIEKDHISVDALCDGISQAIVDAATETIPRGCRQHFKPFWSDQLQDAVNTREKARRALEKEPNDENKINYNKECAKVKLSVNRAKREHWRNTTGNLNLAQDGTKAWSLLNNLSGDNRRQNPKPMTIENETIAEDQKKAEIFNKHFASISKATPNEVEHKAKIQDLKIKEKAPNVGEATFEENFTLFELNRAMKKLKARKSPGQDKIHNEMLVHLGLEGKRAVLSLINFTWQKKLFPKAWRNAVVSPILKKGKPQEEMSSYRPISVTSCLGKLAERMVNTRLYWWLETTERLSRNQAGFRAGHRTTDQLFRMSQRILDGFQRKQHTTAVFVDLKQAYDRVWRKGLLLKMRTAGINGNLYQWIKQFLTDRTIQTRINNGLSSKETVEDGLPQGSPLSCTLFLLFINDLPDVLTVENALYADDLAMWHTSKYTLYNRRKLAQSLDILEKYCEEWKLKVNAAKTVYTIFSISPKVSKEEPKLLINGNTLKKEENPMYLGVKLDTRLTLSEHLKDVKKKATNRFNIVKKLASTSWGADKNTLRQLYIGYVRSSMDYSLTLQSVSSLSSQQTIDKIQNQALRFISGAMKSTPTAACEVHTNVAPMHLRRESAVIEAVERYRRLDERNPNKILTESERPPQRIKKKSILSIADSLNQKFPMPEQREQIQYFDVNNHPGKSLEEPTVKKDMKLMQSKKDTDQASLMLTASATINDYPDEWIQIYTDGSATKGTSNAGYGSRVEFPDGSCNEIFNSCGTHCSNFDAESEAILKSLDLILSLFDDNLKDKRNIVIFTDAKSVLQSLEGENASDTRLKNISNTIHKLISSHKVDVILQWIPGHVGLPGNERADKLAKMGAQCPQTNQITSMRTAKQIINENMKKAWMTQWAEDDKGRSVFNFMPTPNKNDPINKLRRAQQVVIFRLRSEHIQLNKHLNRIGVRENARCPLCSCLEESVAHYLYECPALDNLRTEFLPPNPDPKSTLFGDKDQLENTYKFHVMANSRRVKAQ